MSSPTPYDLNQPQPPQKATNWVLWVIVGLVVALLVCGGICGGCAMLMQSAAQKGGGFVAQTMEGAMLQVSAMSSIQADPTVTEKIGNITGQGMATVVGPWSPDATSVVCTFEVNGEKGNATATVTGNKVNGALQASKIEVKFADGTTVDVPPSPQAPEFNFELEEQGNDPAMEATPTP